MGGGVVQERQIVYGSESYLSKSFLPVKHRRLLQIPADLRCIPPRPDIFPKLDFLFIYADREHGGNFGYLTGFEPRFEEAVLVLHGNGQAYFLLGNENLKMAQYARISSMLPVGIDKQEIQIISAHCS